MLREIIKSLAHTGPHMVVRSLTGNWDLAWEMTKRSILGRYRGSFMGLLWSFFNPLLMLAVYTFVFGVIFQARWSESSGSMADFALILFTGLVVFNIFSECIIQAPGTIIANSNYVKRVVFPLEILSWVNIGTSLFHAAMSLVVLLVFYFIVNVSVQWTCIFLPLVLLPLIFLTLGFSWFLSSLGVYVRDVSHLVAIGTTVLMFMSPIFYPLKSVPVILRPLIEYLNPLTFIIVQARKVVLWGMMPDWTYFFIYLLFSIVIAWLGLVWFESTRKGFADVL